MAITDIDISETLEAGAPSIKYTGDMDPNMQMASASDAQQQEADKLWQLELKKMELDQDYLPEIIDPEEMKVASDPSWEDEWEQIYQNYKIKQIELGQEFVSKEEFMEDYQNNMASGGRVNFGLGSIFKSVGKAAKKAIKSPLGKAALLGLGAYGANAGWFGGGMKGWGAGLKSGLFGQTPFRSATAMMKGAAGFPGTEGILGKLGLTAGKGSMMPTALGWGATALGVGMGAQAFENMSGDEIAELKNNPEALRAYLKQYHTNTHPDKSPEEVDIWVEQNMFSTGGRVGLRGGGRGPDWFEPRIQQILEDNPGMTYEQAASQAYDEGHGGGRAEGGRIGYADRGTIKDMTISNNPRDPKNMTTEDIIAIIKEGRSTPEMFAELRVRGIEGVDEVEIAEFGKTGGAGDVAYSFDERLVDKYNPETGTSNESFLMKMRENNPDVYGKYERPQRYPEPGPSMEPSWMKSEPTWAKAQGGRIGFAYGPDQTAEAAGIMGQLPTRNNGAGVKELDLRDSGGFIPPVGVKEKADDIPAMLSNNEFVMTADAVRAAGGGSVEKGAQVMYDQMKKLENKVA